MIRIHAALSRIAQENPSLRATLVPMLRQADKWKDLPKGWDDASRKKFWDSLTGDNKHKVTKCIEQMKGKDGIDDPGAFCAALADRVLGPEWRSKKAGIPTPVPTAALPPVIKRVLAEVRFSKRKISVNQSTSFSMYSAGDDGAKGFTALVDIDTQQYKVTWGAFGGGALGQKPSPVDDVNTPKKALPDHLVVVQGQIGGRDPYATIICTPTTFPRLIGAPRVAGIGLVANDPEVFINSKTKALAKVVYGQLKDLKPSYNQAPDIPSNVGGFITHLFKAMGDSAAYQRLHSFFGNMRGVGDGFGVERELDALAHDFARKVNKAEAVALGILLLRGARRPRAADAFAAWAEQNLDLSQFDPSGSAAGKVLRPAEAFEEYITPDIKGVVVWAWQQVGKNPAAAETLAAEVAEDVNWHSLGVVGSDPNVTLPQDIVQRVSQKLDYGLEDTAAFIVALLRVAGLTRQAEAVKREALREFADAYVGMVRTAQKVAFNKFNAPELVSQLLAVLEKEGLLDALNQIKMKKLPEIVEKAWSQRGKSASSLRMAMNTLQVLMEVFQGVQPHVKDWHRFIRTLMEDLAEWPDLWGDGLDTKKVTPGTTDTYEWTGKQIGGYGYRGNRGFDPPEYDEASVEVAGTVHLVMSSDLNLRTFPRVFTQHYRNLLSNPKGFMQAIADLVGNRNALMMLSKILKLSLQKYIEADPIATAEAALDEIEDVAKGMGDSNWSVDYNIRGMTVEKVESQITGTGLAMTIIGEVTLDPSNVEPPEPDYEPDDYDDRW